MWKLNTGRLLRVNYTQTSAKQSKIEVPLNQNILFFLEKVNNTQIFKNKQA